MTRSQPRGVGLHGLHSVQTSGGQVTNVRAQANVLRIGLVEYAKNHFFWNVSFSMESREDTVLLPAKAAHLIHGVYGASHVVRGPLVEFSIHVRDIPAQSDVFSSSFLQEPRNRMDFGPHAREFL